MARKAVTIPTRAVEAQDEFVNRKPEPEAPTEPTIRLSVDLPESLHTRLKVLCVINRQRMTDRVRKLIERDVAEAEQRQREAA
jgi:hypothetical protein